MERLIISVSREGAPASQDLEISAALTAEELGRLLPAALGWEIEPPAQLAYEIHATPPGRALRPDETLPTAGAWDGAHIIARPRHAVPLQPVPPPEPALEMPPMTGFVWKRLDE